MFSIQVSKVMGCYRGMVWKHTAEGTAKLTDIAEHEEAPVMLDALFTAYDISAVRLDDGTLERGDQLSTFDVAELYCLQAKDREFGG